MQLYLLIMLQMKDGVIDWGFYRLASGDYITDNNGLTIGLKPTDNQKTLFKNRNYAT